ncbi:protease modulator HflC [Leucothrix sargassi]|nr:protease modulator HflC [Leucothrix sargassi]
MKNLILIGIAFVLVVIFSSAYIVDERETAIKFKFGEIVEDDIKPGLHFKLPIINRIESFSSQILTMDAEPEQFLTNEKKYVVVDFFVKWKISETGKFYRSTGGDLRVALNRLESIMKDGLRNEFSKRTIQEAISGERDQIMDGLQTKSNEAANQLGVTIVDVRVSQIDFSEKNSESVFKRMRSERQRVAQDLRSRGAEEAERIQAAADRDAIIIEADAYSAAEKIRGQGDAQAADAYAEAYQKNPEFFSFYRSLEAYRKSMGKSGDVMVMEPDSEFFRYFKNKAQ